MALRGRRQADEVGRRVNMREKLISVGDDFWIEDDCGNEVASIRERKLSVRARDTYGVEVRSVGDVVLMLAVTVAVDALAHD